MRKILGIFLLIVINSCSIVHHAIGVNNLRTVIPDLIDGEYVIGQSHFKYENTHYIINTTCSLNGQKIFIPANSKLSIINSKIDNGTIVGSDTFINAGNQQIFGDNITLKGTFSSFCARPRWFGIYPDCHIDKFGKLISGTNWSDKFALLLLFDHVKFDKDGTYYVEGHLSVRSNQVINGNNSTIKWSYVNHKSLFSIGSGNGNKYAEDVKIHNLNIIGNTLETDDITEHCHGICVGYSSNVLIEDINVSYCRGDGVHVGSNVTIPRKEITPKNVIVSKVLSRCNHRQGMSITRVDGLIVKDSQFSSTKGTAPSAGIDIEPNKLVDDNGLLYISECININISNCIFSENDGYGLLIGHSSCDQNNVYDVIHNISISDCQFEDNSLYLYGGTNIQFNKLEMNNSPIEIRAPGYLDDVTFDDITMRCHNLHNDMSAVTFILYALNRTNSKIGNIEFHNLDIHGFGEYGINIPEFKRNGESLSYIGEITIKNANIRDCSVPIYVGTLIKNKTIKSNTYVPTQFEKLSANQQLIRAQVPSGIYICGDNVQ